MVGYVRVVAIALPSMAIAFISLCSAFEHAHGHQVLDSHPDLHLLQPPVAYIHACSHAWTSCPCILS